MYHLVQPVWSTLMPMLLERAAAVPAVVTMVGPGRVQPPALARQLSISSSSSISTLAAVAVDSRDGDGSEAKGRNAGETEYADTAHWSTATWLAVPILKACQHTNVSVRRMGLYFVLQHAVQPSSTNPEGPAAWWVKLLSLRPARGESLQHPPSGVQPPSPQQQSARSPALWLLEQLLPVLEHDKISWEHMPGCSSLQRHATAVRQLCDALTAFL
ncbi:hypothetical protein VaNZ11_012599, partial [Volvox africanus]